MLKNILKISEIIRLGICLLGTLAGLVVPFYFDGGILLEDQFLWFVEWGALLLAAIATWSFIYSRYKRKIYRRISFVKNKGIALALSIIGIAAELCILGVGGLFVGIYYFNFMDSMNWRLFGNNIFAGLWLLLQLSHMGFTTLIHKKWIDRKEEKPDNAQKG